MAPALASLAAILLILASGASGQAGNTTTRAAVPATTTATPRVTTEASPVPGVLTTTFVSPAVSAKASPSPAATVVTTSSPATTTPDAVSTSNSTGNPVYTGEFSVVVCRFNLVSRWGDSGALSALGPAATSPPIMPAQPKHHGLQLQLSVSDTLAVHPWQH
eukprot:GHUV01027741.1.p1 GENE.GHUV01027741.1~~GHUV01027741.1.p1  ORF type:complete len:162 (-),score=23.38 GHUV01027741.1:202-687(-)